ncbi:MAG: oligosaccharide flippase family protein [Pseudomonadota bacterium]
MTARILRNVGWIFSSQIVVSLCSLIAMAATARALGADGLAIVALVEAYMRLTALIVHLEPWQAVMRFGSEALERGDAQRFRTLIRFSTIVDLVLGLAAAFVAFALAKLVAPLLNLEDRVQLLQIAAFALAVSFRPTGLALLRLFDRFDRLARLDAITAVVRLIVTILVAMSGAGPEAFVAIVIIFSLADGILAYVLGRRVMAEQLEGGDAKGPLHALRENPGLLRMFFNSNAAVILRQATQRLDVILLATIVSPAAVGYYHIAKRSAQAGLRLGRPLAQALYPELARVAVSRDDGRLSRLIFGASAAFLLVLVAVVVPVLFWIEPLIVFIFTEDFRPASVVVGIQISASAVLLAGVAVVPAMLSLDRDVPLVLLRLFVTTLFFIAFWPMTFQFGAEGAAATHLLCNLVWLIAAAFVLRSTLARRAVNAT